MLYLAGPRPEGSKVQARSQGVAWGGNATPGTRECLLFAIPQNFVSTFFMDFSSLSLDCRDNLIKLMLA